MSSIASLLNPVPFAVEHTTEGSGKLSNMSSPISTPVLSTATKQKKSKAAPVFKKGKTNGPVNYKPCEDRDETIAAEHEKFEVNPFGHIADYPRHIPYASDKKSFQLKTGRDAFEAYQYTFRMPGGDRDKEAHAVMWDYNVGLVRITSFFKSLDHQKTMPSKVMNANPGLREISHSITGGSIGAQGYWLPFEAAKAVAATFCYQIRYALTPVFGLDFLEMCTEPSDPAFLRVSIDRDIILRCTRAAKANRVQSHEAALTVRLGTSQCLNTVPSSGSKSLRPKQIKTRDVESGYGTDSERSTFDSPRSFESTEWTPVNVPRSTPVADPQIASPEKTQRRDGARPNIESGSAKRSKEVETSDEDSSSNKSSIRLPTAPKRRKTSKTSASIIQDARAAFTLMQLHAGDVRLSEMRLRGTRIRRASS